MKRGYYKYNVSNFNTAQKTAIESFIREVVNKNSNYEKIDCPLCSCTASEVLFLNDRYGIPATTVRCKKCSLVFQNPRLTKEKLIQFYSSDNYRNIYGNESVLNPGNFQKKFTFDYNYKFDTNNYSAIESMYYFIVNSGIEFETICEIGAGGGWNLAQFNLIGKSTIGYEPNRTLVKMGSDKGIKLEQGFLEEVSGEYDLVILRHVLEHLSEPIEDLKKIIRHNNKYLFVEVPGIIDKLPSIQNAHNFYFSLNTLNRTLAKSGYKTLHAAYFQPNNFIMLIAEKKENYVFNYSYSREAVMVKNIVIKYKIRHFISDLIDRMALTKVKDRVKSLFN